MVHRIALMIGAVAAVAVLAVGVVLAQSGPSKTTTASIDKGAGAAQVAAAPQKTVTDKVYVLPTPQPKVIHVTKQDKPAAPPPAPKTIVITRTPHNGGENDGEHGDGGHERGGD